MSFQLRDYTFILLFSALSITVLTFFSLFFFEQVVSENGAEKIKQYMIDVALVDPSFKDILQNAKASCDPNDKTAVSSPIMSSSLPNYIVYGLLGAAAVILFLHIRSRFMDKQSIFTTNELLSLSFLMIPVVFEIILYYFVYQRYKFYSNVYLIKLMKNLRIRADLNYLTSLYSKHNSDINNQTGDCVGNCLDASDRSTIIQKLQGFLTSYNNSLDASGTSECAKIQPSSIWQRIKTLPGVLGLVLTVIALAFVSRAIIELNGYNSTVILCIAFCIGVYAVFLYLLHNYVSSGQFISATSFNYLNRLFCVTDKDLFSKLLNRNLSGVNTQSELDALMKSG